MATPRHRLLELGAASFSLAGAAVLALTCATGDPSSDASRVERDFYYSDGRRIPLLVALDSLAVLSSDSVFPPDIEATARLTRTVPGGLRFFGFEEPRPRADLVRLAREVQTRLRRGRAGFVAWPVDGATPFVVTDLFIARFRPEVTTDQIEALNRDFGVRVLRRSGLVENRYLLAVTPASPGDALTVANRYYEDDLTEYAHPNFLRSIQPRDTIPDDAYFGEQWHLHNIGQNGGTEDADIDAPAAWDFTLGDPGIVIAVLDGGFETSHPDLGEAFVPGWDFIPCVDDPFPPDPCGDPLPHGSPGSDDWSDTSHGTLVAGVVAARGWNDDTGVVGVCPRCRVQPLGIPYPHDPEVVHLAVEFAHDQRIPVMSNSWGYYLPDPPVDDTTVALDAASHDMAIFFAMSNEEADNCDPTKLDIAGLPSVIGVSRSTNHDLLEPAGFGDCLDLLAPSAGSKTVIEGRGTLFGASTDRTGTSFPSGFRGFNDVHGYPVSCPTDLADKDYTRCFRGTSFAAPVAAGVAGLVLSADPTLGPREVRRLLQDTADRIEHAKARYRARDGFSAPAGGSTHGYGRINAFEAVRVVAPASDGGRAGIDLFVRDNALDWGNTERPSFVRFGSPGGFIGYWSSPDIKVDAPPYHEPAVDENGDEIPFDSATFEGWADESPVPGGVNRIYVRVRNRGPATAERGRVKLLWTRAGTALPVLPGDFWSAFPSPSSDPTAKWSSIPCKPYAGAATPDCLFQQLVYSGSSLAAADRDPARVLRFEGVLGDGHMCLLAIVDAPQDRVQPKARPLQATDFVVDSLTPHDNNVGLRNYIVLDPPYDPFSFMLRNPRTEPVRVRLRFEGPGEWRALRPSGDQVPFPLPLDAGAELELRLDGTPAGATGEVEIVQEAIDNAGTATVMGGMTVGWRP